MAYFIIIIEILKQVLVDFFVLVILAACFQTFEVGDVVMLLALRKVVSLADFVHYLVIVKLVGTGLDNLTVALLLWLILLPSIIVNS